MKHHEIVAEIIILLNEAQESYEEDECAEITEDTIPIIDLIDFDSLIDVMLTCYCIEKFELDDHLEIQSIFHYKDDNGEMHGLTVSQVADQILKLIIEQKKGVQVE